MPFFVVEQHLNQEPRVAKMPTLKFKSSSSDSGNTYSKRANRGHNPKYEQDAYVSFCGSKRRHPEGGQHAKIAHVEKETLVEGGVLSSSVADQPSPKE